MGLAAETEMNNKNKEIQTLHSSLTEAMVSKERLEQRMMELVEMSQHSMPDDSLQSRVQVRCHNINHLHKICFLVHGVPTQYDRVWDMISFNFYFLSYSRKTLCKEIETNPH